MRKHFYGFYALLFFTFFILFSCSDNDNVSVTGIELNKKALSLKKGTTETLVAKVLPQDATNKAVAWTSSDILIATVSDNGIVTANSVGAAVIIATTRDGQFTATCQLTVLADITTITLSTNNLILERRLYTKIPLNSAAL